MKFTIKRNAFIKKLTDVQRAISSKTAIEILTGLKITVTENSITLTGSDPIFQLKMKFQRMTAITNY